jgi:hypothetical protein
MIHINIEVSKGFASEQFLLGIAALIQGYVMASRSGHALVKTRTCETTLLTNEIESRPIVHIIIKALANEIDFRKLDPRQVADTAQSLNTSNLAALNPIISVELIELRNYFELI